MRVIKQMALLEEEHLARQHWRGRPSSCSSDSVTMTSAGLTVATRHRVNEHFTLWRQRQATNMRYTMLKYGTKAKTGPEQNFTRYTHFF